MTSYTVVGIPGWETLDLNDYQRPDCERRVKELVWQAVPEHLPRDSATPFRRELHRHLARLVEEARSAGASLLCLPTQKMGDIAVPASYTVAEWRDEQEQTTEQAMLEAISQNSDGTTAIVDIDGQLAVREDIIEAPNTLEEPLAVSPARRISYTVASPRLPHRWVVFTFTTLGDGNPEGELADLLVRMFDAQLTTLRWQ